MSLDKSTLNQLKRFAQVFKDARERSANESDTVMYLIKFFEDVLGYDSLKGEISKETPIKDRYCDIALKIDGETCILVECKAAGIKGLTAKHIEQAENYASRGGVRWVLLANGIEWKLYHLDFNENEGIAHDLAFEANLIEEVETNPEALWCKLSLLSRKSVASDALESYWAQKKSLKPASLVKVLFGEEVLTVIRRELNRHADARVEIMDVFAALRDVMSKEALLEAGEINFKKRRRKRRRVVKKDAVTGHETVEEVEDDSDDISEETVAALDGHDHAK